MTRDDNNLTADGRLIFVRRSYTHKCFNYYELMMNVSKLSCRYNARDVIYELCGDTLYTLVVRSSRSLGSVGSSDTVHATLRAIVD